MVGITNITTITQEHILNITNVSSGMSDFAVSINHTIYGGVLYFVLLWLLWVMVFAILQQFDNQPLNNAVFGGVFVSVLSFFLRAIEVSRNGVMQGLLTDFQMYAFPLLTIVIAVILYATKD